MHYALASDHPNAVRAILERTETPVDPAWFADALEIRDPLDRVDIVAALLAAGGVPPADLSFADCRTNSGGSADYDCEHLKAGFDALR